MNLDGLKASNPSAIKVVNSLGPWTVTISAAVEIRAAMFTALGEGVLCQRNLDGGRVSKGKKVTPGAMNRGLTRGGGSSGLACSQ